MFLQAFKSTFVGTGQIFLLGAVGYFLVKRKFLSREGVEALSKLVVYVTLPLMIFVHLLRDFKFSLFSFWWAFPLLSILITLAGFLVGKGVGSFIKGREAKQQFLSLTSFQNSGYLPLGLIAALLVKEKADVMFIYLFLFLLGFNLLVWSIGVYLLSAGDTKRFEFKSLFSPPVIAIAASLLMVALGIQHYVPALVLKPLQMLGDCTLVLAMVVVGGNLAQIDVRAVSLKSISLLVLTKLLILPACGLIFLWFVRVPELVGLLIIMQLAVPSATSLSVIVAHYKKNDLLISQGVFFTHIVSLVTLPLFLSIYFTFYMLQ